MLIDGIRFRDPSAITGDASSFISDFTLTSVAKVEVFRGSGSSLYGTNASAGSSTIRHQRLRRVRQVRSAVRGADYGLQRFRV